MALTNKLSAIGDAIRAKTGGTEKLTLDAMPDAIYSIETADSIKYLRCERQDLSYMFRNGSWDWWINAGNHIYGIDINNCEYMFYNSGIEDLSNVEINCVDYYSGGSGATMYCMFKNCYSLKEAPIITGATKNQGYMFENCYNIRDITKVNSDGSYWAYNKDLAARAGLCNNCYSLRYYPISFFSYGANVFSNMIANCYALDEIKNLGYKMGQLTKTSNLFTSTFDNCHRLKSVVFNYQQYPEQFLKSQNINLTMYVGYADVNTKILNYNSGITADKEVVDDASYQALKNDKDWFTCDVAYSRYNHDSAVETINSLPDTSEYLASKGGTNNIRFKGTSGSKTDGGAINTMTEEEIVVATAKGWTVSYV